MPTPTPTPTVSSTPTPTVTPTVAPMPVQTVDPTIVMYAPDPSAWSADTTIALIGVIVALIGAVATGLLAWFALEQTKKATRLEQEASDRSGRAAAASAIDAYLAGWKPEWGIHGRVIDYDARRALRSAAATTSSAAREVADWVITELDGTIKLFLEEHRDYDSQTGEALMSMTVSATVSTLRGRLIDWVAKGEMNQDTIYKAEPAPPQFPTL